MRKIPTLFERDPEQRSKVLIGKVTPGCEWVLEGEGVATRKYDGTCMLYSSRGQWWARREVKPGRAAPPYFQVVEHDEVTGKTVGWEPIEQSPFVKFHAQAVANATDDWRPGTYELCGPKINGNPEGYEGHILIPHDRAQRRHGVGPVTAETAEEIVRTVGKQGWEGIVWHHPDGRMAKLKVKDLA